MKKGFTLIEMLVVVVVLVTLMSITFRLSSIGEDETRRSQTIARLQRVENCLSGYYAAFGTYPPVREHGYSTFNRVNQRGFQQEQEEGPALNWYQSTGSHGIGTQQEIDDWKIVRATCMNQPLACRFPYPEGYKEVIEAEAELAKERLASGEDGDTDSFHQTSVNAGYDDGYSNNPGRHDLDEVNWAESQLFQFGLMSHLLPRYQMMMSSGSNAEQFYTRGRQWLDNNSLPCRSDGSRNWSWSEIKNAMTGVISGSDGVRDSDIYYEIQMMYSQSVCRRWLPNLEKSCYSNVGFKFYGVEIADDSQRLNTGYSVFAPGGSASDSSSQQYVLSVVTVTDGWHNELYYYSPPPYQSYILWSGGPNGRTYPKWMSTEGLDSAQKQCVGVWTEDDIVNMSN